MYEAIIRFSPAIVSLIWAMLMLLAPGSKKAERILFVFFICVAVSLAGWALFCYGKASITLDLVVMTSAMAIPPLYYKYVAQRLKVPEIIRDTILFSPTFLLLLCNLVLYIAMGRDLGMAYLENVRQSNAFMLGDHHLLVVKKFFGGHLFRLLFAVESILALGWTYFALKHQYGELRRLAGEEEASYIARNVKKITRGTIGMLVASASICLLPYSLYSRFIVMQGIISLTTIVAMCLVGYFVLYQRSKGDLSPSGIMSESAFDVIRPATDPTVMEVIRYRFEKYLQGEPYLSPKLSLEEVAQEIRTNRTYLSEMINHYYGKSFSDIIAEKRVEHAVKMIENGETMVKNVAFESGYRTMSTFYRNFASVKKMTFTEWMRLNDDKKRRKDEN